MCEIFSCCKNSHNLFLVSSSVVQDESHLFLKGPSARVDCANMIESSLRWGVTATPATTSLTELSRQLVFVQGQLSSTGTFGSLVTAISVSFRSIYIYYLQSFVLELFLLLTHCSLLYLHRIARASIVIHQSRLLMVL